MTVWESLEEELAYLFRVLCSSTSMAPMLAYGAAIASTTRNNMLKAAAAYFYYGNPDELTSILRELDIIGKLAGRRNDIAHGRVIEFFPPPATPFEGFYLSPPSYHTAKGSHRSMLKPKQRQTLEPSYQLTASQIDTFTLAFSERAAIVRALAMKAMERPLAT